MNSNTNTQNSMFGPDRATDAESINQRFDKFESVIAELLKSEAKKDEQISRLIAQNEQLIKSLQEKDDQAEQAKSKNSEKVAVEDETERFERERAGMFKNGQKTPLKDFRYVKKNEAEQISEGDDETPVVGATIDRRSSASYVRGFGESKEDWLKRIGAKSTESSDGERLVQQPKVLFKGEETTAKEVLAREAADRAKEAGQTQKEASEKKTINQMTADLVESGWLHKDENGVYVESMNGVPATEGFIRKIYPNYLEEQADEAAQESEEKTTTATTHLQMLNELIDAGRVIVDEDGHYVEAESGVAAGPEIVKLWHKRLEEDRNTVEEETARGLSGLFKRLRDRMFAWGVAGKGKRVVAMANPAAAAANVHTAVENKLNEKEFFTKRRILAAGLAGGAAVATAAFMLGPKIYAAWNGIHASSADNIPDDKSLAHLGGRTGGNLPSPDADLTALQINNADDMIHNEYNVMDNYDGHALIHDAHDPEIMQLNHLRNGVFSNFGGTDGVMEHLHSVDPNADHIDGMEVVASESEALEGYAGGLAETGADIDVLKKHGITDMNSAINVIEKMDPDEQLKFREELFDYLRGHKVSIEDKNVTGSFHNMYMSSDGAGGYNLVQSVTLEDGTLVHEIKFVDDSDNEHVVYLKDSCGQLISEQEFKALPKVEEPVPPTPPKPPVVPPTTPPKPPVVPPTTPPETPPTTPPETPPTTPPPIPEKDFTKAPSGIENNIVNNAPDVHLNGGFQSQAPQQQSGENFVDQNNQTTEQITANELATNTPVADNLEVNGGNWIWNSETNSWESN